MALFEWNQKLSVGVTKFDDQHKELIRLINDLHDAMLKGHAKEVMSDVLKRLSNYTVVHFSDEEKAMQQYSYPRYPNQKEAHTKLIAQLKDIEKKHNEGMPITMEVMNFLKDWLTKHIIGEDKMYGSFFNEKGVK